MKSTKKRFNEGGTSEDKEAGLEASKGEPVGFLERLRMGNIDDPSSEAFKRLGAGRGREAKSIAASDRKFTPPSTSTSMPEAEVEMPAAQPRVARQVVAAREAGEDLSPSERISADYARPPGIPPTEAFARKAAPAVMPKRQLKPSVAIAEKLGGREKLMLEPEAKKTEANKPKDELADDYREALMERIRKSKSRKPEGTATNYRSVTERLKEQFGFKNGGSVSGPSRGDGIAQRGKTRGKMC